VGPVICQGRAHTATACKVHKLEIWLVHTTDSLTVMRVHGWCCNAGIQLVLSCWYTAGTAMGVYSWYSGMQVQRMPPCL
jgi:hypothetical protein